MRSIVKTSQRVLFGVVAVVTVAGFVLPTVALAAQVTEKSIELSSSSVLAKNVNYNVKFKAVSPALAFVIQFCSNTPLIGQACTAPTGFDAENADSSTANVTEVTGSTNEVLVEKGVIKDEEVNVDITGIDNPSVAGPLYARIVTYDTVEHAGGYTATNLGVGAQDQGSVAISITPSIAVSGTVLETMTFCVSGSEISANCSGITSPVVTLGENVGSGVIALTAGTISTGNVYTQISTNASMGAVIRLKSSATDCGGLIRAGSSACDIAPALNAGIDDQANQAKFGVKTSDAASTQGVAGANGTLVPVIDSGYNKTTYALNFVSGNSTGVTSTFGDPFLDTAGAPANNQNMALTFGAIVASNTPAGSYSADLSLIASGKF